ncbi:GlsB/YeaQ/YmgE family stress response membrane protein [Nocardioides limicola]|uniref:GlsB/YeaQ/YmgE family stress response membrane protein n=1 Tax=Nocardioides limicola TaxID=2803368 RepID=UPI001EF0816A|nr:hypothetical protein [Nocardioides sp. DJM-14]
MGIISFIIVGLLIGAVARLLKSGKQDLGLLATIGLGCVAALIAGTIASLFGDRPITDFTFTRFVIAVIAAVLLVGTAEGLVGRKARS